MRYLWIAVYLAAVVAMPVEAVMAKGTGKAYCAYKVDGFEMLNNSLFINCKTVPGGEKSSSLFATGSWGFEIPDGKKTVRIRITGPKPKVNDENRAHWTSPIVCEQDVGEDQTLVYRGSAEGVRHKCELVTRKGQNWGW